MLKIRKSLTLILLIILGTLSNLVNVIASDEAYDEEQIEAIESNIYISEEGYYYYYNPETEYIAMVEDDADRLTDDEEYNLLFYMYSITEFGSAYYKSISENPYSDAADYARDYLNDEKGCYGGGSGTVFLDDTVNRRLEIFSNGEILRYITKGKAVSITDNVYQYASNAEYYECASEAFWEIETLLWGGRIAEPMKYTSNFFFAVIISLMLCFIVAIITSSIMKASVSEVMNAAECDVDFTNIRKTFSGQTRKYDPPSDSSSGGSSGGGGGGGGGGGHSY